jgi:hypothetical protein
VKLARLLAAAVVALPACAVLTAPASAADDPWIDGTVKLDMAAQVTVKGGWAAGTLTLANPTDKPITGQRVLWRAGGEEHGDPLPKGSLLFDWAEGSEKTWHRVDWGFIYPETDDPAYKKWPGFLYSWMGPRSGITLAPHSTRTFRLRLSLPQSTMTEPITDLGIDALLGSGDDGHHNPEVLVGSDGDRLRVRGLTAKLRGVPSRIAVDGRAHGFTLDIRTLNKADWKLRRAGFGVDPGYFDRPLSSCDARIELRDPVTGAWHTAPMNVWGPEKKMPDLRRWASGPVDHRVVTARLLLGGHFTAGRHMVGAGHYPGSGPNNFFPTASFTAVRSTGKHPCLKLDTTAVTGFNASPEPVRKGAAITVSGTLKRKSGSAWKALPEQKVSIFFQARGSRKRVYAGYDATDAKGRFTKRFTARQDGTWSAVFTGTTALRTSQSGGDHVDVR